MQIINTLEFYPAEFVMTECRFPDRDSENFETEWLAYWASCLSNTEFSALKPVGKFPFIRLSEIGSSELIPILSSHLEDVDLADYEDQVGALAGGVIVKVDETFPIVPQCCGSLGNIDEWLNIFTSDADQWHSLWIGHPWVFYRPSKDVIEFSDYSEATVVAPDSVEPGLKVARKELWDGLRRAKKDQEQFRTKIATALSRSETSDAEAIARLLVGA